MNLQTVKNALEANHIYYSEDSVMNKPSVIGYEKVFKWKWIATQLNTFIVTSDFGDEQVDVDTIKKHLEASFNYTKIHYSGWPRGLQSGIAVISILISSNLTQEAIDFCVGLQAAKKYAAFTIPVVHDATNNKTYEFKSYPMWGRIYFPHFRHLINEVTKS